jgi:hypothetical protein
VATPDHVRPPAPEPRLIGSDDFDDEQVDRVITLMEQQFPGPVGCTEPRLFTPPLRELTPETTLGFQFITFCHDVLREPLQPWQAWVAIHALELAPGSFASRAGWRFRFKVILIIVARQNGKSDVSRRLKLFRIYATSAKLVIGTAQDLDVARKMLELTNEIIDGVPTLAEDKISYITANGKEKIQFTHNRQYVLKASNSKAGRGSTADHVDLDELREHHDQKAWAALSKTTRARPNGQLWGFSNAGDDESVVLNKIQTNATARIRGAKVESEVDESITDDETMTQTFMAEWSGPSGCELTDVEAIRQANPGLGYLFGIESIWSDLENDTAETFRTETLCQRVEKLDAALDLAGWKNGEDPTGTLAHSRDRISLSVDVSLDGLHTTAVLAAELADGRYRVEAAGAWDSTTVAVRELRQIKARVKPQLVVWFKNGPGASIAADLRGLADDETEVREISGAEVAETCMEFANLVANTRILHGVGDELFNPQVTGAGKKRLGDGWVFVRTSKAHVDAVYAMAGAVHGARTMPAPVEEIEPMLVAAW